MSHLKENYIKQSLKEQSGFSLFLIVLTLQRHTAFNLYRHTLFTPLYTTRGSFGPGNI